MWGWQAGYALATGCVWSVTEDCFTPAGRRRVKTVPWPRRLRRAHPAVMPFGDGPHERQSQAAAWDAPAGLPAIKFLPYMRLLVFRDARAGIGHFDDDIRPVLEGVQFERVARAAELQRVIQQVVDGQQQQIRVALDIRQGPGSLGNAQVQVTFGRARLILRHAERFMQQGRDIHRRMLHQADFQLGQFAQVGRQAAQAQGLGFDAGQRLPAGFIRRRFGQVGQPGPDGGERVFQFVIQAAQETPAFFS